MLLEEIYRGNFTPSDFVAPCDPEYKAINQKILELTDQLRDHLSPDDYQLLDELVAKIYTANCMELEQCFAFSFSAGMILHQEAGQQVNAVL